MRKALLTVSALVMTSIPAWAGAPKTEAQLIERLRAIPTEDFMPDIEATMRAGGCSFSTYGEGEENFARDLAHSIARREGYDAELSLGAIEEIGDLAQGAARAMVEQGAVMLDMEARQVTLVDCE